MFYGCLNLEDITIGNAIGIGEDCFLDCAKITFIPLNNCTSFGNRAFGGCLLIGSINAPLCNSLGSTINNDGVFNNIKFGITITVSIVLATANAGLPDGDLVYAAESRGATIVYV